MGGPSSTPAGGGRTSRGGGGGGGRPSGEPRRPWPGQPAEVWTAAVEADRTAERVPSKLELVGPVQTWLGKKVALHHVRGLAPQGREEGRFEDLEGDVASAAPQCLRFVAAGLERCRSTGSTSHLQQPYLHERLGDRLSSTVASLKAAGEEWRWEIESVGDVHVDRIFLIIGGSRTGSFRRGSPELPVLGQHFVLTEGQRKRFLDSGIRGRLDVLQELLFSEIVLVADASMTVKQRSWLRSPGSTDERAGGGDSTAAASAEPLPSGAKAEPPIAAAAGTGDGTPELPPPSPEKGELKEVRHVLRFEMSLTPERSFDEGPPNMRASAWQIADWNWICLGNHPGLPPDVRSPC